MEQQHYTFIVKIRDSAARGPQGYVVDNTSQARGYFEGFPGLEEFIMSHLGKSQAETDENEVKPDK